MAAVTKLKSGEYAWICCAIKSAVMKSPSRKFAVKSGSREQAATPEGYKPFADFFGGNKVNDGK